MHLYKRKRSGAFHWVGFLGIFFGAVLLLGIGSRRLSQTADREQTELLREAVNQATISCYATEGRYPADLDYLIEHYGLQVDTEHYIVTYEIFADNVRPRIRVTPIRQKGAQKQ